MYQGGPWDYYFTVKVIPGSRAFVNPCFKFVLMSYNKSNYTYYDYNC